jgi:hypothetical protein
MRQLCQGKLFYRRLYNILWKTSVIRVKVVAPEKSLDINTFPKNNPDVDFTIYVVSKYLCVDTASCDIQKYFMLI